MTLAKIAMYDMKEYDRKSFQAMLKEQNLEDRFEIVYIGPNLSLETAPLAASCQAICAFVNDDLSAPVVAKLHELGISLIVMRCAGFDKVDLAACTKLGISVARVPAYSPHAVAEHAAALLLTLNRKIHRAFSRVREGNFTLDGLTGFDLYGKTVGVVGTGKIGQCFIDIALGFGCNILCYDIFENDVVKAKPNCKYVTIEHLLQHSDVISLHAPATKETTHVINHENIQKMKPAVIIINTSRGSLIDSKALVEGLVSGRIGGAGLDVYEHEARYFFRDTSCEELRDDTLARLTNMRNCIVTSHQAFLTTEALRSIAETTVRNLREFFVENKRLEALTNYVPAETPAPAPARK